MERDRWIDRFKNWVKHEPVRAAEVVRGALLALTVLSPFAGFETEITSVAALVTAAFSIYASKLTRDRVSPVAVIEEQRKYDSDYEEVVDEYA